MAKKPKMKQDPWPEYPLPRPSAQGVEGMREIYRRKTGKEISYEEAEEVLSRIVRFQYLNFLINTEAELRERAEDGEADGAGLERGHEITREPIETEEDAGGEVRAGRARGAAAAGLRLEPG